MLRVLIVDDEAPARQRLRKLLVPLERNERVGVFHEAGNGREALELLENEDVDVLFLDIRMPGLDGFETLERIHPDRRPVVIFTTAYDEYAIRAFEANAIDYLLKPLTEERLAEAVGRAEKALQAPATVATRNEQLSKLLDWLDAREELPDSPSPPPGEFMQQVSIPYRDRILIVPVERLLSAEINEGITRLFVADDSASPPFKQHIVSYTLDQLESNLDPSKFMRVHRGSIVRIAAIEEMVPWFSGRFKLVLAGGHEVIASRERSRVLKERMMI